MISTDEELTSNPEINSHPNSPTTRSSRAHGIIPSMTDATAFNEDRAKGYDDRALRLIPGYEVLHDLSDLILSAELPANASLLVGGAGTGMEIARSGARHPAWTFLGVDPSEPMVATGRQRIQNAGISERVRWVVGSVEDLPEEETFDAATLLLVLHFIPDHGEKEALLSAIADRLKPGAPLLMATMFGEPDSTRYKRLVSFSKAWAISQGMEADKAAELCNPARTDLHIVSEERVKALLRNGGFIDVQRIYQALSIGLWLARTPR